MLSLWSIWTFVKNLFSFFFKEIFLEIVFSARKCSIVIENNGAPVPGVANGVLNDRSLFFFSLKIIEEFFIL